MLEFEMIQQKDPSTGCGVACVAYVLRQSYASVLKAMTTAGATNSVDDHNVKVEHLVTFLTGLRKPIYVDEAKCLSDVKGMAFLYVKWPPNKRYRHWVVYRDGLFYDPGHRLPLKSYPVTPLKILTLYLDPTLQKPLRVRRVRELNSIQPEHVCLPG